MQLPSIEQKILWSHTALCQTKSNFKPVTFNCLLAHFQFSSMQKPICCTHLNQIWCKIRHFAYWIWDAGPCCRGLGRPGWRGLRLPLTFKTAALHTAKMSSRTQNSSGTAFQLVCSSAWLDRSDKPRRTQTTCSCVARLTPSNVHMFRFTLFLPSYTISNLIHFKLWLTTATHNFKNNSC